MSNRFKFTGPKIESLPIPASGSRATYHDEDVPGFQLRVTGKGIKTFSLFRWNKLKGSPDRVTLGKYPEVTVAAARSEALKVIGRMEGGESPADAKRAARGEQTFGDFFAKEYLEKWSKVRKRTWREDKAKFDNYLAPLAARKLSSIRHSDVADIHAKISRTKPITANRVLALVSSIYGRARKWGAFQGTNPARGVDRNPEQSRDRFLSGPELARFFQSLADESNTTIRDFLLLALLTGARRSNVLAMRWEEIDVDAATWRIPRTKNEDPHTVPLVAEALAVLNERRPAKPFGYVFPGRGGKKHLVEPKEGWRRIFDRDELRQLQEAIAAAGKSIREVPDEKLPERLERARAMADALKIDRSGMRIADLRIHDLRRTLGSWQARTGASLAVIGKTLAHRNQATTAIYARLDLDPVRESVERATSEMFAAAGLKGKAKVRKLTTPKKAPRSATVIPMRGRSGKR